ncbi:MAG: hypothetical protein ABIQ17_03315 [Candidatus Limnocylindrales bacterium]
MTVPTSNRARRFSLPDLGDDGVDEAIEAFLRGPVDPRAQAGRRDWARLRANHMAPLATSGAWMEALVRESDRSLRYGRPAAVLIIKGQPLAATAEAQEWLSRVAAPIAHAVRRGVRETDVATQTSQATFQVLLPETTEREAIHAAQRMVADCEIWLRAMDAPIRAISAVAGTRPGITLEGTLVRALEEIRSAHLE